MIQKISNYLFINSVLGRIRQSDSYNYSQLLIKNTKLFGLYLYDYSKSDEFDFQLNSLKNYTEDLKSNGFYHLDITSEIKNYTKEQSDIYSLCQILEVDYNDLPILILTNNLNFNSYYIIKTKPSLLGDQLNEINQFCISQEGYFNLYEDFRFKRLINNIDSKNSPQLIQVDDSLAQRLADYLSFFSLRENGEASFLARNQIQKIFSENILYNINKTNKSEKYSHFVLNCLSNFKDDIFRILNDDRYINLNTKSESVTDFRRDYVNEAMLPSFDEVPKKSQKRSLLSILKSSIIELFIEEDNSKVEKDKIVVQQSNRNNIDILNENDFEIESQIIYNTFISSYKSYKTHFKNIGIIDFSMFLLPLCKIFEIEINLSVVQWIRNELEIEMPQYYNLYKDTNPHVYKIVPSSDIIHNPKLIDFNKKINGKWTAPPLGQSELIAKTLYLNQKHPTEISNFDNLLSHWKTIRENRNESSHTIIKTEDDFNEVYKVFIDLYQTKCFSQMNNLKLRLKNN